MLKQREDVIKLHGYNHKDRIILEGKINDKFKETEQTLKTLKDVFKSFTEKNKNKVAPSELDMMSKNIDVLWRNLNILEESLKSGQAHWNSEQINPSNELEKPLVFDNEYNGDELTAEEEQLMKEQ